MFGRTRKTLLIPLLTCFVLVLFSVMSSRTRVPNLSVLNLVFLSGESVIAPNDEWNQISGFVSLSLWGYSEGSIDNASVSQGPLASYDLVLCDGKNASSDASNSAETTIFPISPCKDQIVVNIPSRGGSVVCRIICVIMIAITALTVALPNPIEWATTISLSLALVSSIIAVASDVAFSGMTRHKLVKLPSPYGVNFGISFWLIVAGMIGLILSLALSIFYDCKLRRANSEAYKDGTKERGEDDRDIKGDEH